MPNKLTPQRRKALEILLNLKDPSAGITASAFAQEYYSGTEHEYLLTAVSNQGEGACGGKKAWLCAGSYLAKLVKEGLVRKRYSAKRSSARFLITDKGRDLLKNTFL